MWILEFIKKLLEGKGFYPIMMVILTWSYTVVLMVVLIFQFILYIFGVKCNNCSFKKSDNEEMYKEDNNK